MRFRDGYGVCPSEPSSEVSIEFEHEPQRLVNGRKLIGRELANEVAEAFWGNSSRLLNEHLC